MNTVELLAKYERVADAPDAVEKMRALILDLAVSGRMTDYEARAEELVALGTRAEFVMGQAPPGTDCNDCGIGTPFVKVGEFGEEYPVLSAWTTMPLKFARTGDVLICVVGATVGKLNMAIDCAIGRSVAAIRSDDSIDQRFLFHSLKPSTQRLRSGSRGTAQGVIGRQELHDIQLWIPPLAEQHRIVAKVDELMDLCDQLEAARKEREVARNRLATATLARLNTLNPDSFVADARFAIKVMPALTARADQVKQLRQAILNLAVRGKLVPQDPSESSGRDLVQSILIRRAERAQRTGDPRIKSVVTPDEAQLPVHVPGGWAIQSFDNLFLFIDYRGNTPTKTADGVPLVTAKNVRMGYLSREPQEFVSHQTYTSWMTRGLPELGDLFFTTEAPLGNVCLNDLASPFALAQRVICLQPYGEMNTKFFMYALMSDLVQGMIHARATGMTAKGIKAANLKPIALPVPPLAEQNRIVAKVEELMTLSDQLEASLAAGDSARGRLLNSVLHEALESSDNVPAAPSSPTRARSSRPRVSTTA